MSLCVLPPTIGELAQDYGLPALADLFSQKVINKKIAEVKGLTIPELQLENADLDVVFSYADEFRNVQGYRPTVNLILQKPDEGRIVACAYIGTDKDLNGRFNHFAGSMPVAFESLQFAIDHPPHKLIKDILGGYRNAQVKRLV